MEHDYSTSIIVPTYNSESTIEECLQNICNESKNFKAEIIVIDDFSKDKTLELLESTFGNRDYVKIIPHKVNQNLGQAIRTGFKAASGDIIVTMDSDCTYSPQGIFEMLGMLDEDTDIVTASPTI